ncbi:hypothetical protein G7Z17_g295 [Cylindrodendrum hubeiense]|uniref:Glycerate dehydrogenase n=1 Tax=Cylindrodendrum hubeiense TaxID=595255 RepID=A0A9P5HLE2_9HYPO|nr:hypothetical protein G7Z17_g295 [Cylindrodendrum hubeiense]
MANPGISASDASAKNFNIVALETFFTPLPELAVPSPHTFTLTEYTRTSQDELHERIKDADVLITTAIPLRADALSVEACPNLKLIAVLAAGTDSVDLAACTARGIRVMSSPNCNADVVAEHALALYFAVRRTLLPTMRDLRAGEWPRRGTLMKGSFVAGKPPRGCRDETAAIIGYGHVGKNLMKLLTGLGMKVIVSGRKGAPAPEGRVTFDEALKTATVIFLCCPRSPETLGLIAAPEFDLMQNDAVLVNVSRGGIVDEGALFRALTDGRIHGAGVDVFDIEPAGPETSVLLGSDAEGLNLVATPHAAWIGGATTSNYQRVLCENINGFISGKVEADRVRA